MAVVLMSLAVFATAMLIMAVGVIFKRPCLRGSCGGPEVLGAAGEALSCATCPNRKKGQAAAVADEAGGESLPVVR